MTPQVQALLDLLAGDDFPYAVAILRGKDPDLGPIPSVLAFDVAEGVFLDVNAAHH